MALQQVTDRAAEVASIYLMGDRFGSFPGRRTRRFCILYANMGRGNQGLLEGLRRKLIEGGVGELAVGIWPRTGEDRGYTLTVLIDSADHEMWLQVLRRVFVKGE
jgi:hypothetical protein